MSSTRVLLVDLDGLLAAYLGRRLDAEQIAAKSATAVDAVERLVAEPPDVAVINLELSQGSGFGLVNRVRRMEALAGLKLILVADNATQAAMDAHRESATHADAYVSRVPDSSTAAFAEAVFEALQRLLGEQLPEIQQEDLVEIDAAEAGRQEMAALIAELGYRVLRRLPDEDGGAVYACMDDELDRAVAIKLMMPDDEREDDERLQRFQRERRILALLHSPFVVGVYGAGTHRGTPYLVRELIDGEDLERRLKRDGPLDVGAALARVRETALGLKHAADAGVIHRDVRPANIHVVDGHAKLARFGMGRRQASEEQRITREGAALPDLLYVAPERVLGHEDARSDIYSLGVTLHTLIAGAPPFLRATPVDPLSGKLVETPISLDAARAGTPPKVSALVAQLMAEDPARRPQRYDEVLRLIDDAMNGAASASSIGLAQPEEPTAVHGTLRLMGVVEIVQGLELATRTATVTLHAPEGTEGKLAFSRGRLVHASFGSERGESAFFTLVAWRRGAFRVDYVEPTLERNIDTPTAGLLLEAARREDEASAASAEAATIPPQRALVIDPGVDAARERQFFADATSDPAQDAGGRAPDSSGVIDVEHSTSAEVAAAREPRRIPSAWGFVIIAVVGAGFVWAGLQLPATMPSPSDDDTALQEIDALLSRTRADLRHARLELAAVGPKLAAFEAQQASAESVEAATRRLAAEVHANLEAALKPELGARRLRLHLSGDGSAAVLEIEERTLFSGEGDEVHTDGKTALARITGAIASLPAVHVRVEGHTDDTPPSARSPHKNNWGLSGARALAVAGVLTEQGLPAARVSAVALADSKPVASNRGPKGRARNRRVELHLMPQVDATSLTGGAGDDDSAGRSALDSATP